ncbi:MAG: cytochrome c biogenesis protein CcsA [Rheinheimera sp.]|nr:cytochrome c biogenesis protein CcsA [Rheinheimera sp.]
MHSNPIVGCQLRAAFAALIQLLVALLPSGVQMHHFEQSPWLLSHILIAFITYVILIMATLYSFQVSYISHKLKQKTPLAVGTVLPPLMQAEQLLFRLVSLGTLLLAVTLISGAIFDENFFAMQNLFIKMRQVCWHLLSNACLCLSAIGGLAGVVV